MSKGRGKPRRQNLSPPIRPRERTSNSAALHQEERRGEHFPHWEFSRVAGSHELKLTAQCIADIADPITRIRELSTSRELTPLNFQRQIRYLSIPIRKLILSGDELLLRRCFVPRLHPLKIPIDHEPDVLTEWGGDIALSFTDGSSADVKRVSYPTEHSHETVVRPLYGLQRTGGKQYQLEDPFDWSAEPIKESQWLNGRVLRIDDMTLTAAQLLRMMANREGSHSEGDEMLGINFSGPVRITLPDAGDEEYRRANTITFGQLTYIQIFTYLVGIYLVNMMKASLKHIPAEVVRDSAATSIWDTIICAPSEPIRALLHLDKAFAIGVVFQGTGDPDRPVELVGDYENTSTTLIQIPG